VFGQQSPKGSGRLLSLTTVPMLNVLAGLTFPCISLSEVAMRRSGQAKQGNQEEDT
jgi:hypothetical protein